TPLRLLFPPGRWQRKHYLLDERPQEQERSEHRVGRRRLVRPLVGEIVLALPAARREEEPERRPADEGRADRREAPARRLPRAVRVEHPRACDAAARAARHERPQDSYCGWLGYRVRVRDHDELAARGGEAAI